MAYTLELIATGMVTFRPAAVLHPGTMENITFVMMDNPTRRRSSNYPGKQIEKHVGFLLAHRDNIVDTSAYRPSDLPPNAFGYGGWILDKERLSLEKDPKTKLTFDQSMKEIANIASIPATPMDPAYADIDPPRLAPVAGQLFLQSGSGWADGKPVAVEFRTSGDPGGGRQHVLRNEVHIAIDLPERYVTIATHALGRAESLVPLRLKFADGQTRIKVYFGSAPPAALLQVPSGEKILPHAQDVDFELYYDICKGGPPARRPIPHRVGSGTGPVPGSERCPPLQNG